MPMLARSRACTSGTLKLSIWSHREKAPLRLLDVRARRTAGPGQEPLELRQDVRCGHNLLEQRRTLLLCPVVRPDHLLVERSVSPKQAQP